PQLPLERGHISQGRRLGVMSMFVLFMFVVAGAVKLSSLSTLRVGSTRAPLLVLPLTTLPGVEDYPAFSPDGSQVAYSWVGPGASSPGIYVKLIGPGTTLQITRSGLGADVYPAWSPDGKYLAFYRKSSSHSGYYLVSALGGPERLIATMPDGECFGLDWSLDSKYLVAGHGG